MPLVNIPNCPQAVIQLTISLVDSYIKADDPSNFAEVIEISSHTGKHDDLVRFLQMAQVAP